jgi:hypothetical protein
MCWVRYRLPVLIVSWWGPLQWVNPLQPSVRSVGQSFFSLLLCCCSSRDCNMWLLWFPSLSWSFILFSWMTFLMNDTFRSSCKVWLVTYQGAFVIIRSILDWLRCIWSMYLVLVRMEASWNKMWCPWLMLCSAMADLSRCSSWMWRWCTFNLTSM